MSDRRTIPDEEGTETGGRRRLLNESELKGLTIGRRVRKFRRPVSALTNLPHFQRPDGRRELGRADIDEAHGLGVAAAADPETDGPDGSSTRILALLAPVVQTPQLRRRPRAVACALVAGAIVRLGRVPSAPKVDWPIASARELADQIVHGPDGRLELRRAHADEAHEVRVAAAVRLVAEAPDQLRDARVLALLAASVERLDGDDAVEGRPARVVVAETDRRPSRMAGEREASQPGDLGDQLLRRQADVGEVEAVDDVAVHAIDQHVAVVGLHLGGVEGEEAAPALDRPVGAPEVELSGVGEHDAVERALGSLALEHLQVCLDGRAAVVRELGVEMQVEDHAGRNFGSVISAVTPSNTTSTAMPMRTSSGAQPTRLVTSLGPSASSTMAST